MGDRPLALSRFFNKGAFKSDEDLFTPLPLSFSCSGSFSFSFSLSLALSSIEDPGDIGIIARFMIGAVDSELTENMDNGEALFARSILDPSI